MIERTTYVGNLDSDIEEFDEGLRQLMLTMYNHTASGLAVSGAVAWLTYSSGLLYAMGGMIYIAMFAPLGMNLHTLYV